MWQLKFSSLRSPKSTSHQHKSWRLYALVATLSRLKGVLRLRSCSHARARRFDVVYALTCINVRTAQIIYGTCAQVDSVGRSCVCFHVARMSCKLVEYETSAMEVQKKAVSLRVCALHLSLRYVPFERPSTRLPPSLQYRLAGNSSSTKLWLYTQSHNTHSNCGCLLWRRPRESMDYDPKARATVWCIRDSWGVSVLEVFNSDDAGKSAIPCPHHTPSKRW